MSDVIPRQNPEIAWRNVDGSAALVSAHDTRFYWLNPVATRIWELADGTRTFEQIGHVLCEEFDVDLETSVRDAIEMVDQLRVEGLFAAE